MILAQVFFCMSQCLVECHLGQPVFSHHAVLPVQNIPVRHAMSRIVPYNTGFVVTFPDHLDCMPCQIGKTYRDLSASEIAATTRSCSASPRNGCIGKLRTSRDARSLSGKSPHLLPQWAKAGCSCKHFG